MKIMTFINFLFSYLLYVLSGHRIKTPLARKCIRRHREKNIERIRKRQSELDEQHSRLRGWTMNDARSKIPNDPTRDRLLNEEILRTQKTLYPAL